MRVIDDRVKAAVRRYRFESSGNRLERADSFRDEVRRKAEPYTDSDSGESVVDLERAADLKIHRGRAGRRAGVESQPAGLNQDIRGSDICGRRHSVSQNTSTCLLGKK